MIKRKEHPKFVVPNFGEKRHKRVQYRWRKQRGIDNKKRVKRSGYGAVPNIGYKNNDSVRGLRQEGRKSILINNRKELESATQKDAVFVFSHALSKRKRLELQEIADAKGFDIANRVRK
jgi:large subunit ribosomal protein L32e